MKPDLKVNVGNMFQVKGYVRTIPQTVVSQSGVSYTALVIARDRGSTNIIVYFKGKLAEQAMNECVVGSEIIVNGLITSETIVNGINVWLRQFNVATSLEITKSRALRFNKNVLIEPLLELENEEDLFKRAKRLKKLREKKDNDQSSNNRRDGI